MSDLVENPEDRVSHNEAHIKFVDVEALMLLAKIQNQRAWMFLTKKVF